MTASQANSEVKIRTPLGEDILLLRNMTMTEELGRLFTIDLELLSAQGDIKFEDILGQNVTIEVLLESGEARFFNGYLTRFSQTANSGRYAVYQATVTPWLWFLTRTADCRIFQNKKVPEIVKEVFRDLGFTDFVDKLSGTYRTWDYCVQYRETDFSFVSRLLEQEGIYYYFTHHKDVHKLVLSDSYSSHEPLKEAAEIPYYPPDSKAIRDKENISSWFISKQIQPGKYELNEYDFERPKADLISRSAVPREHDVSDYEVYDYPGEYTKTDNGDNYVQARIEELHAQYEQAQGKSDVRVMQAGCLFKLTNFPRKDQNREYLITRVTHHIKGDDFESSGSNGGAVYSNNFTVIESQTPYRAARITPKPIIQGTQTAKVVGPKGETIHTDKYARVKLQFHWDRYGKSDENSSCWVRVSQNWAGKKWGDMHIPHVGHEVIVSFLEGDPDRPIVTGRVYNADNMPKEALAANKTKSVWSDHGGNETVMEGKDGKQTIHTQQSCGHELLMDGTSGSEKIELRDKYGNEIIMDSVAGTVRIHSPTHESTMTLGKSAEFESLSDLKFLFKGDRYEEIFGAAKTKIGADVVQLFIGADMKQNLLVKSRFVGGWKQEMIVGAESKSINGAKSETIRGTVFKKHMGKEYEKNESGFHEKTPTAIWMVKESFSHYNEAKNKIREKVEEIENKKIQSAAEVIAKYEVWETIGETHEEWFDYWCLRDSKECEIDAAKQKIKAINKWHVSTPNAKVKSSAIKLG